MKISFGRAVSLWKLNDFLFNLTPESKVLNESVKYINNFTSNVIKERKQEFIEKFKDEVAIENRLFEDSKQFNINITTSSNCFCFQMVKKRHF